MVGFGHRRQLLLDTTGARLKLQIIAKGPCDVKPSRNGPGTNVAW